MVVIYDLLLKLEHKLLRLMSRFEAQQFKIAGSRAYGKSPMR